MLTLSRCHTGSPHGSAYDLSGTKYGQASTPHASWACSYLNANGPNIIYDDRHSYHAMDSNIMSLGHFDVHITPFNQGQTLHFASHPYLASKIEEVAPLGDYDATSAAYGPGTNTGGPHLIDGVWPSGDPLSPLMGYDHGVADINPSFYLPVLNPTLAPGTVTAVQAGYESAVASTDGSRPQCSTCNTTFKRAGDLARHEKKHQAGRAFKCLVPGCSFKGSYRKDKLDAHVKSCHRRGAA